MVIKNKVYPKGVWFPDKEESIGEIVGTSLVLLITLYIIIKIFSILKLL